MTEKKVIWSNYQKGRPVGILKLERHHAAIDCRKSTEPNSPEETESSRWQTTARDEQVGFRKERSCTNYIATLWIILEQSLEWNPTVYTTFVDCEKAFDSVDREVLWKLLRHYGALRSISPLYGRPMTIAAELSTTKSFQNWSRLYLGSARVVFCRSFCSYWSSIG